VGGGGEKEQRNGERSGQRRASGQTGEEVARREEAGTILGDHLHVLPPPDDTDASKV
jgi:hypothetical protein